MRGILFLVVGPSGAGKDSLIAGARQALADDPRFLFPRRVITRAAEAGGEDHVPMAADRFDEAERQGAFCLSWRAHGLAYGVPAVAAEALAAGRSAVVNASRSVIGTARAHLAPVRVVHVTAAPATLARRLATRGRESAEDIAARLARADAFVPVGPDVRTLANDGPLEDAIARFVVLLRHEAALLDAPAL